MANNKFEGPRDVRPPLGWSRLNMRNRGWIHYCFLTHIFTHHSNKRHSIEMVLAKMPVVLMFLHFALSSIFVSSTADILLHFGSFFLPCLRLLSWRCCLIWSSDLCFITLNANVTGVWHSVLGSPVRFRLVRLCTLLFLIGSIYYLSYTAHVAFKQEAFFLFL